MATFKISSEEIEALRGEPHAAFVLYMALRARMDFATGLVGAVQGAAVSWQAFREALHIDPAPGVVDSGTPSKAAVRRLAERLERRGLVRNESKGRRLMIRCLLAQTDSRATPGPFSVPKKPGTNPAQTRHTQPDRQPGTGASASNAMSERENDLEMWSQPGTFSNSYPAQPDTVKPGTPPVSGISGSSEDLRKFPRERVDQFFSHLAAMSREQPRLDFRIERCRGNAKVRDLAEAWCNQGVPFEEFDALVLDRLALRPDLNRVSPAYFVRAGFEYLTARLTPGVQTDVGAAQGRQGERGAPGRDTSMTREQDAAFRARDDAALLERAQALSVVRDPNEDIVTFRLRVDQAEHRVRLAKRVGRARAREAECGGDEDAGPAHAGAIVARMGVG